MNTDAPTLDFTLEDEAWLRQIQIRPETPEVEQDGNAAKGIINGLLISGLLWLLIGLAVAYWRGW